MRNPENVLISLTKHSNQKDYKYERLYRLLYNEELYLTAYQNIYSNDGSMTKVSCPERRYLGMEGQPESESH